MKHRIRTFARDEAGAVTVDWVVLTAAVVGLAGAIYVTLADGSAQLSGNIEEALSTAEVAAVPSSGDSD